MRQPTEDEQHPQGEPEESGRKGGLVGKEQPLPTVPDEEFEKLAQYSFEKHQELMRRLAG